MGTWERAGDVAKELHSALPGRGARAGDAASAVDLGRDVPRGVRSRLDVSRERGVGRVDGRTDVRAAREARAVREPKESGRTITPAMRERIAYVLAAMPSGLWVMTAAFESKRSGVLVSRVMRCGDEPALVAVAVKTGQRLAMLLRDSRAFGLCSVGSEQRLVQKKFGEREEADPFDTLSVSTLTTGAPMLLSSAVRLDCEIVRHFDLEADHEIYVGLVVGAEMSAGASARTLTAGEGQAVDVAAPASSGPSMPAMA